MSFGETVAQILSLFFIMVVGYVMNKRGIIDETANVRFTRLIINISLPAQIVKAFVSNQGIVSNQEVISVFGISFVMYLIYAVIGILFLILTRVKDTQRGTYLFMMMFGNVGFMGFPVIEAMLGEEAMIYAVIFNVVFNLLVYSVGILMISRKENGLTFAWKKLLNMPLMSAVVSIVLYFANISLPDTLMRSLNFMGNMTTPVAMLILGSVIANMRFKELFSEWRIYLFTAVKLILIPFVAILIIGRLPIDSELIKGSLIVLSAMPVATNSTMISIEYGGDVSLTSKGVFFTTLLCMITIPFISVLS